jgi:hypothetical protein
VLQRTRPRRLRLATTDQIVAADFFVVPSVTYRLLFVLVLLAHDRRRIRHLAVTAHPTAAWTAQQLSSPTPKLQNAGRKILRLVALLELVNIDSVVLDGASHLTPMELGTLYGIHLARALLWKEMTREDLAMSTHDAALAIAAGAPRPSCCRCQAQVAIAVISQAGQMSRLP